MAELPSGAVTFLFTDIEGSTRLVKQLRDRYREVLADHQRLLRDAFAAHHGYEVDTQGDSFFVAFSSARDALLAAVEGQLALAAYDWPDGAAVRVRMGLHTGQAVAADGRYTGLAVHRAARIGAAGHGGQILVSQATQTLLEDEEEDLHVFLRDLGEQRLKDLDRPVRLYQAAADGLPEAFPPVRREAEPVALDAEPARPLLRRPAVLAAAAIALALVVAAAVLLGTRDSSGGLGGVRPNHVGVIDPATNQIVAEVPVGIAPGPVDVLGGSVWVGNVQDRSLTRIDAGGLTTAATISLGSEPRRASPSLRERSGSHTAAAGRYRGSILSSDGSRRRSTPRGRGLGSQPATSPPAWAQSGRCSPIDPCPHRSGCADRSTGSTFAGSAPAGVVVGSGSVWVANFGEATVSRFNPLTFDGGAAAGPERRPAPERDRLRRGRRSGSRMPATIPSPASIPAPIPLTTIPVGARPVAIAVGGGAVWVASAGAGTVSRIDPVTRQVTETIEVGNAPSGVAVGDGGRLGDRAGAVAVVGSDGERLLQAHGCQVQDRGVLRALHEATHARWRPASDR